MFNRIRKNASKRVSVNKRNFCIEGLESRQLMAGDVTAQVVSGNLVINEAPGHVGAASNIAVTKLANGNLRVAGITSPLDANFNGVKSLVNGKAFVDFAPIQGGILATPSLKVNLGDGDDAVHILGNLTFENVDILMNRLATATRDADLVNIRGMSTRGSLTINTGVGDDKVLLNEANIGDGIGSTDILTINTGKGSDTVRLGDSAHSMRVKGYVNLDTTSGPVNLAANLTELGDDQVSITSVIVDASLSVVLGGGNDKMDVLGSTIGYRMNLSAGDGIDTVKMRDVTAVNGLFASLGNGNDTLELYNVDTVYVPPANLTTTDGTMQLDGGAGFDTLIVSSDCNSRLINKLSWEVPTPGSLSPN
jgi:hypothetical protein